MGISRVNRSKSAARLAYDRMSRYYDLLASRFETPMMHKGLKMLAVQEGDRVLEIGCGTGEAMVALCAQVGMDGRIYGIDLSPKMLKLTRRRLRENEAACKAGLVEGDGCRLPCREGSVDCIFMSFTLELFDTPEIPEVLQECRRVLEPDGRLVVVALEKTQPPGSMVRLYEWFHARMPAVVDCRPIHAADDIRKAGFAVEKTEAYSVWGLPVHVVRAIKL